MKLENRIYNLAHKERTKKYDHDIHQLSVMTV